MSDIQIVGNRAIKDGLVGVLVSVNYGAGWSTWNLEYEKELLFDPNIVSLVVELEQLRDSDDCEGVSIKEQEIVLYAKEKYPDGYYGGVDGLTVEWMPPGTLFQVNEYDGSESIKYAEHQQYFCA